MTDLPLHLWHLPEGAGARLINVSENRTYLVEAPGFRAVLRVHRPGYQRRAAIESELAWLAALSGEGSDRFDHIGAVPQNGRATLQTPAPIAGRDGRFLQGTDPVMVLFEFIEGETPSEDAPPAIFETLGGLAATLHQQARDWVPPAGFERPSWDAAAVFGAEAAWGNWRAAPHVTPAIRAVLETAETRVQERLGAFGCSPDVFGLIHADMRAANLLVEGDSVRLIDFDDCGFGWFLYDFAAAVSFIETRPDLGALKAAWLRGYRRVAPLSHHAEEMLDTFVMLRRLALLAWIGSHAEAPEPQALAPDFARDTAALAERYLTSAAF